jgi:hypothetical protein
MPTHATVLTRIAPYAALAAGTLLVTVPLLVELVSGDAFWLMGPAALLVLVALPGLRRLQDGQDGAAGAWGVRLALAGLAGAVALVLSGDALDAALDGTAQRVAEAAFLVVGAVALLSLLAGVALLAVGMARAGVFPRGAVAAFVGGMALALVSEGFEQSLQGRVPTLADVLPPLGFVVAGAGLLAIGRAARQRALAASGPVAVGS